MRCTLALIALTAAVLAGHAHARHILDFAPCRAHHAKTERSVSGVFRVYAQCDRLLLEIPSEAFDRDMLVYTELTQVWTTDGDLVPGMVADNRMMRWHRRGASVQLQVVDFQMRAGNLRALQRGVEASQLAYVYRDFDVVGEGAGGAPIVDATPLFAADASAFAFELKQRLHMVSTDPRRSYVERVKVFPNHIQVRFFQTWLPDPKELTRPRSPGESEVSTSVQFGFTTSIVLLPREPMRGRYWDERVGYFNVPFDDYGTELPWHVPRAFITRFRLEKKDPDAAVSEPVEPIVFYLSPEVPQRWRPYIKRGIEDWQIAFEAAGFRHAIVARDAPTPEEDPEWDPEDARYSVVRWVPSARQAALGPNLVDPRSGEVISAHLILWHDILRLTQSWYVTQAGAVDPRAAHLPLPEELTGELLRYVVAHELAHALGLRHNFKAASAYSIRQLRSPEWTLKWGTTASITSYGRINYVAQPGDGAALLPRLGPYDFFAIEWGYKPLPGTPEEERATLDRMAARQESEPMLRFGGEDDAAQVDPTVTMYVLGSDPILAADLGLHNVDRVMDNLLAVTASRGNDYTWLADLYEMLVMHRYRQLDAVARLVGGVAELRDRSNRGAVPFTPVEPARARAAVRFLLERGFATPTRLLDPQVLWRIAPHGGLDPLQGSNLKLLQRLLDPGVFERLAEAAQLAPSAEPYLGPDLLHDLNLGLFEELKHRPVVVSYYRRELQRNYVQLLAYSARGQAALQPPPGKEVDRWPLEPRVEVGPTVPGFFSQLATAARAFGSSPERPSEFRAATRVAAGELWEQLRGAAERAVDGSTAAHLAELMKKLDHVR